MGNACPFDTGLAGKVKGTAPALRDSGDGIMVFGHSPVAIVACVSEDPEVAGTTLFLPPMQWM